jgi:hypothetical protein
MQCHFKLRNTLLFLIPLFEKFTHRHVIFYTWKILYVIIARTKYVFVKKHSVDHLQQGTKLT